MYKKPKQTIRQKVWQYLLTTGTPQPPTHPPLFALTHHANFGVSIAHLQWLHCQWQEVTPIALWKTNTCPKQTGKTAGYLKKKNRHTGCLPALPTQSRSILRNSKEKKKKVQIRNAQKIRYQLNLFLNRGKDTEIHLQSAFWYSPTGAMIDTKCTLPTWSSTLCCQAGYNLKKICALLA